ncbi:transport protein uso1 [Fusarium langsethiae]|uniref:Transport protein uso1 n=1 Tax=Fusarium langsethiae TaxID=179993 RepID=A0A0M9F3W7_FUSLA|nr:transport protein uso1 [Fusarium langsethiae]
MSLSERDSSYDGEFQLRHPYAASSDPNLRALVPMWDSSDPERCPPPLPMNPGSPLTSRAGTSSAIASAHAALNERAQQNAMVPAKRIESPTKGHRRLQSSVRDISLMIEGASGHNSPSRSPERQQRPETPTRSRDHDNRPSDTHSTVSSSTPVPGPSLTPIMRPAARRPPPQSILGENTPPQSSTMLALQHMSSTPSKEPENPLSDITNGSTAVSKGPQNLEALSDQILSLTSIATGLQKEMSQLSRRSRDNATDLLSLKEATNSRDEDIRKSLRELLGSHGSGNDGQNRLPPARDPFGGYFLDNKPHNLSPPSTRGFQLPRIPSPKSFGDSIERGSIISTPSLIGSEANSSLVLLERIIREMGTKEGQESLLGRLQEVSNKLSGMATSQKLDEVIDQVRAQSEQAIISYGSPHASRSRNLSFESENSSMPGQARSAVSQRVEHIMKNEARRNSEPSARGSDILNDDLMSIIRSVKDSVSQGGGLTAEVKALVRELRGEVLGMGREIGKRLDQQAASKRSVEDHDTPSKDEVARVIDEGLEQMKDQLNHVLREHRRQSAASVNTQKSAVDYQEIYNAMRAAIQDNEATKSNLPDLSREDVIEAVRDAWENYKPEIEVQQIGLERDEVLACLKQGMQEYSARGDHPPAASRDDVLTAVVEGLQHYVPPQVDQPATLSRDEIIDAVRDCLEEFEFPVAPGAGGDFTHEDMVHAVREGLQDLDVHSSRALVPASSGNSDDVSDRLREIMEYLRQEFKTMSEEAKENVAATGRETEQVLGATKDGFESLREAMESYVDRATGAAGQEEFMDDLLKSLEDFKDEMAGIVSTTNQESREQLQTELEGLREIVNSSMIPAPPPQTNNTEVLEALNTGFNNLRQEVLRPRAETSEILDALNDGLNDLRAGMDRVTNKPTDLTANDEILDALKAGLDSVRADIESIRDSSNDQAVATLNAPPAANDEIMEALKSGLSGVRADLEALRDSQTEKAVAVVEPKENDEVLEALKNGLDALRVDIEAIRENTSEKAVAPVDTTSNDDVIAAVKTGLESLRADFEAVRDSREKALAPVDKPSSSDEFVEALKNGLESLRADIESARETGDRSASDENTSNDEVIVTLKTGLDSLHAEIAALANQEKPEASVENTSNDEVIVTLKNGLDSLHAEIAALANQEKTEAAAENTSNDEVIVTLKNGLDSLHTDIEAIAAAQKSAAPADNTTNDEVIEALKNGLDSLRTDIEALQESNQKALAPVADTKPNDEVLDALKTGLESLRSDIESLRETNSERAIAPAESLSDEKILEALKTGLESVRSDIEALRDSNGERALAAISTEKTEDGESGEGIKSDDVKNLEVLIAGLAIKIDSVKAENQGVQKDDLSRMEELLRTVQDSVDEIASRETLTRSVSVKKKKEEGTEEPESGIQGDAEEPASKEDMQAIETILRNTKGKLDDLIDGEQAVRKDHIDNVEALLLETRETMGSLTTQLETVSRKEEVAALEALLTQVSTGLDEIKEHAAKESENPDKVSKGDVEAVEALTLEIKTALEGFTSTDLALLARKEDVSNLETLLIKKEDLTGLETIVKEFQEKLDTTVDAQTKAIAVRDEESTSVVDRVTEVKNFLEELQGAINTKLDEGATGVEGVSKLLETMGEKIDKNENVHQDLKDMLDMIKAEFEDSKAVVSGVKVESNEKLQEATETLGTKLNEKIGELVAKYETLQTTLDERSKVSEARDEVMEAALVGSKSVTDELKLLIDTLGSTVTDSLEKMEEASKTVFTKVEELGTRTEETHTEDKAEHQQTRDKITEALAAVEGLKGEVGESHPKIIESVKDLLLLVGEHFEHSKSSTTEIQDKIVEHKSPEELMTLLTLLTDDKYNNTQVHEKLDKLIEQIYNDSEVKERLDKIIEEKYNDAEVREKLDKIIEEKYDDAPVHEKLATIIESKYDDSEVREKLDNIIESKYDDAEVRAKLDKIIEEKYDDTPVKEMLGTIIEQKYDDAPVKEMLGTIIEQKYDDTPVRDKLDLIMDSKYDDTIVREKLDLVLDGRYDDAVVQDKLDKLVEHTAVADQAFTRLDTLDKVHASVLKTAADISDFLQSQKRRIEKAHEDHSRHLQETMASVERKLAEKDHVETAVLNLRDEELRLRQSVMSLRSEQENLIRQKTRLTGDVSSLETALSMRKEELYDMESRAENLERRILEGVMDHSRVLLMSKAKRSGSDAMSRKRVRKPAEEDSQDGRKSIVGMALNAKRNLAAPSPTGAGRRIVSLSQINNNVATGGVKRSQSVRTPAGGGGKVYRKRSWGGGLNMADNDKENSVNETVEEVDEADVKPGMTSETVEVPDEETIVLEQEINGEGSERGDSDNETLRRSSRGTVITNSTDMYTDGESYSEDSYTESEWTESNVGTDAGSVQGNEVAIIGN